MAENEIGEYLEIDANNVDIAGISVQENVMRPPAVNNAFRALQGALKRWFRTDLFRLRDSTDQTKLLALNLSGLTTATTRTITMGDANVTLLPQLWEQVGGTYSGANISGVQVTGLNAYSRLRISFSASVLTNGAGFSLRLGTAGGGGIFS